MKTKFVVLGFFSIAVFPACDRGGEDAYRGIDEEDAASTDGFAQVDDFLDDAQADVQCVDDREVIHHDVEQGILVLDGPEGISRHRVSETPPITRPDFDRLTENLRHDERLASATGLGEVTNCQDAQQVMHASLDLLEAEPSHEPQGPEVPPQEEFPGVVGILDGFEGSIAGTVEIHFPNGITGQDLQCSGVLINPVTVLTSAHCFATYSSFTHQSDLLLSVPVKVSHARPPDGTWECITSFGILGRQEAGTKCSNMDSRAAHVYIPKEYHGDDTVGHDIAVVLLKSGKFSNVGANDFLRVYTDMFGHHSCSASSNGCEVELYRKYGSGADRNRPSGTETGAGTMRWAYFGMNWWGTYHYLAVAGSGPPTQRSCIGDSGGPDTIWDGAAWLVLGLHSGSERNSTDLCTKYGGKIRSARLNQRKSWITAKIAAKRPEYATYYDFTGPQGTYRRYW